MLFLLIQLEPVYKNWGAVIGLNLNLTDDFRILLAIACMKNQTGYAKEVSDVTGIRVKTTKAAMDAMVEQGWLTKVTLPRERFNLVTAKTEKIGGFAHGYKPTPKAMEQILLVRNLCERSLLVRRDMFRGDGVDVEALRFVS